LTNSENGNKIGVHLSQAKSSSNLIHISNVHANIKTIQFYRSYRKKIKQGYRFFGPLCTYNAFTIQVIGRELRLHKRRKTRLG